MSDIIPLRTETGKVYELEKDAKTGAPRYQLDASTGPIHYKESYADGEAWRDLDEAYSEEGVALDGSSCLVYPKLPNITRVFTDKLGYEIQSRSNTDHVMRVELSRINGIDVTKIDTTDKDLSTFVRVHPYRVGLWKQFKRTRLIPWILRWKVTELGNGDRDTHRMQFRETPEAWSTADISGLDFASLDAPKVSISTERERIDDNSWYWYETIPRTAMLVDTDWQVGAGGDDGYWMPSTDYSNNAAYNFFCRTALGSHYHTFQRFATINIIKNSTINSAYLSCYAYYTYSSSVSAKIHCNAADNPSAPTTYTEADALALTSGTSWTPAAWTSSNWYQSASIVDEVQTIVNRAGWSSGNPMLVIVKDESASEACRYYYSYDGGTSYATKLTVTWTEPATGHPATRRMGGVPFARQMSQPGRRAW
jgi:hypothetical protein